MAFEEYIRGGRTSKEHCRITLMKHTININNVAYTKYILPLEKVLGLEGKSSVKIAYDSKLEVIKCTFLKKGSRNALNFQSRKEGTKRITVKGFLDYFKLWDRRYVELRPEIVDSDLYLYLTDHKVKPYTRKTNVDTEPMAGPPVIPPGLEFKGVEEVKLDPVSKKYNLVEYECKGCSYSNPAWKYNKSMKPLGHPKKCKKCGGTVFSEIDMHLLDFHKNRLLRK